MLRMNYSLGYAWSTFRSSFHAYVDNHSCSIKTVRNGGIWTICENSTTSKMRVAMSLKKWRLLLVSPFPSLPRCISLTLIRIGQPPHRIAWERTPQNPPKNGKWISTVGILISNGTTPKGFGPSTAINPAVEFALFSFLTQSSRYI